MIAAAGREGASAGTASAGAEVRSSPAVRAEDRTAVPEDRNMAAGAAAIRSSRRYRAVEERTVPVEGTRERRIVGERCLCWDPSLLACKGVVKLELTNL